MKKFFEYHDLVKIALCMIVLTLVLTWIIPQGYFNAGELTKSEITRIGLFDFVTYGLLGMYYFTVLVTFLFVMGGFYQFLSKLGAYQKLTDRIAKRWKGKEIVFSLIISFVFAVLASMINEYLVIVAFIPFVITICSKLNMTKISAFVTTFGAMLVGILGSTISPKVAGMNVQYFGLKYTDKLLEKIIIFVLAYAVYSVFNVLYLRKTLNKSKVTKVVKEKVETKKNAKNTKKTSKKEIVNEVKEEVKVVKDKILGIDMFAENVKGSEKTNTIPLIVVGIISIHFSFSK